MIRPLLALAAALLLGACEKEDPGPASLTCDRTNIVLGDEAGAETAFTVDASGPWRLTIEGEGFDASPRRGGRGRTRVTIAATDDHPEGVALRRLGGIDLRLDGGGARTTLDVLQSPARSEQTVLMYFPWSGNLTSYFQQNIEDMAQAAARRGLQAERLLVFFMPSDSEARLLEIYCDGGESRQTVHRIYDDVPAFTTAEGIASVLDEVKRTAPAARYAMTIGSHGMAWLPASGERSATAARSEVREREYWEYAAEGRPLTRWFGGTSSADRTDIATLAEALKRAGMKMEYILFDDCYMSSVEVAYELHEVAERLIGSTSEVMAYGFPYATMGLHLLGTPDYRAACDAFYDFYIHYDYPYGTIGVTECAETERLAELMRLINADHRFDTGGIDRLQRLDGYTPVRFFDMGDYVRQLCGDVALLARFEEQLARTVPYHRHTPEYYSMSNGRNPIRTFSGITTSDPSVSPMTVDTKLRTAWWQATH